MQPSSFLCRTQEARQHALATATELANVRSVALLAAAAWAKEALAARRREERLRTRGAEAALSLVERDFSENPDRGFTTAG